MTVKHVKAFRVYHRDGFLCAYCGDKPGFRGLQIDHLIPRSKGGSDHENNLTAACERCNNGKGNRLIVPAAMVAGYDDDGAAVIGTWRWGVWVFKVTEECWWLSGAVRRENDPVRSSHCCELPFRSVHGDWWPDHIAGKTWGPPHFLADFCEALAFARTMVTK